MIGALWNGISGLDSYQKALNVESNNIANVNTSGFKSETITFADMMYQSGYGKGSRVESVEKSFLQGNLKTTGNSYDMAIKGDGFFVVNNGTSPENLYTRGGNFRMGTDGSLETSDGYNVMGLTSGAATTISTNTNVSKFDDNYTQFLASQYIKTPSSIITVNAKATDFNKTAIADDIINSGNNYKTSSSKIRDINALKSDYQSKLSNYATNPIAGIASLNSVNSITFDVATITQEGDTIKAYVNGDLYVQSFETDASTTLKKFADKLSTISGISASTDTTSGKVTITSLIPGKSDLITGAMQNTGNINVITETMAVAGTGLAAVTSSRTALQNAIVKAGADFLDSTNTIDLTKESSLALSEIKLKLDDLVISTSPFGDPTIDNGIILMKQGDNQFAIGKVVTTLFNDNLGLNPDGDNRFSASDKSGQPIAAGSMNYIYGKTLELSNAELGSSLTNLMVFQRAFEANAKSITTSDEFLNVAIQLKK